MNFLSTREIEMCEPQKYQCEYCGRLYFNNSGRSKHYQKCIIKPFAKEIPMKGLVYIRPFVDISRDHISDETLITILRRPTAIHYRLIELIWRDVRNRNFQISDRRVHRCKVYEGVEWTETDKEYVLTTLLMDNEKFIYARKMKNLLVRNAIEKYQSTLRDYKLHFNLYGYDKDYAVEEHAYPTRLLRVQNLIIDFMLGK